MQLVSYAPVEALGLRMQMLRVEKQNFGHGR